MVTMVTGVYVKKGIGKQLELSAVTLKLVGVFSTLSITAASQSATYERQVIKLRHEVDSMCPR